MSKIFEWQTNQNMCRWDTRLHSQYLDIAIHSSIIRLSSSWYSTFTALSSKDFTAVLKSSLVPISVSTRSSLSTAPFPSPSPQIPWLIDVPAPNSCTRFYSSPTGVCQALWDSQMRVSRAVVNSRVLIHICELWRELDESVDMWGCEGG